MSSLSVESRLQAVEDVHAIERAIAGYFEAVDDGYNFVRLEHLLTESFEWVSNLGEPLKSRHDFVASQAKNAQIVEWAFHTFSINYIESHGESGSARWNTLGLHTMAVDGSKTEAREPVFYTAAYSADLRKPRDASWQFERMKVDFKQISRWTRGWVAEQFFDFRRVEPGPGEKL